MIQEIPQDQVVIDGENSVFRCSALAFPLHTVSWVLTHNNRDFDIINTEDMSDSLKYSIVRNRNDSERFGELTVKNVQFDDRGIYICTVDNVFGEVTSNATLTVHGKRIMYAMSVFECIFHSNSFD